MNLRQKSWKEVIFEDLPKMGKITEESLKRTRSYSRSGRYSPIKNTRLSTGRIWTDEDFEARRKRVYDTPLP